MSGLQLCLDPCLVFDGQRRKSNEQLLLIWNPLAELRHLPQTIVGLLTDGARGMILGDVANHLIKDPLLLLAQERNIWYAAREYSRFCLPLYETVRVSTCPSASNSFRAESRCTDMGP